MSVNEITETRQYLTFKLGNEVFGIDVAKVREVLDFTTITEIPRTPDFMSGVINLRGSVVPVVDLRLCFQMSKTERTRNTCIVVVEVQLEGEATVIGALADSVEEVIDLEPDQIQPAPRIGTQIRTDFIKGMGKRESQFIMILDIDRVFSAEELSAVQSAEGAGTWRKRPPDEAGTPAFPGEWTLSGHADSLSSRDLNRLCAPDLRAVGHHAQRGKKVMLEGRLKRRDHRAPTGFLSRVLRLPFRGQWVPRGRGDGSPDRCRHHQQDRLLPREDAF